MTSRKHRLVSVYVKHGCEDEAREEARENGVPEWLEPVRHATAWGAEYLLYEWDQPVPLPARAVAGAPSPFLLPVPRDSGS